MFKHWIARMRRFWSSPVMNVVRRRLETLVDFELNYGREVIRDFARSAAPLRVVLDVGAGDGADLDTCREIAPQASLHAIECDPIKRQSLLERGVEVHDLDIERDAFPLSDECVDLVIANQVLEHVKELFWVFDNVFRVLAIGGHFAIGVPNLASLHNRIILLAGMQPTVIHSFSAHVRGFTRHDLLRFLDTGFPQGHETVGRAGSNFYPFPPGIARPLARALPGLAWGLFLLVRKTREYSGEFLDNARQARFETNFRLERPNDRRSG